MANRSVFPQGGIDQFDTHFEILASDIPNIQRYQILIMNTNRTAVEEDELTNLKTTLKGKLFSSEDINKIQDCMTNLENFFLNDTVSYLNTLNVGQLRSDLGFPANLQTIDKTNAIAGVNEVKNQANTNSNSIGNLASLKTNAKDNLINSINEVRDSVVTNATNISSLQNNTVTFFTPTLLNGWVANSSVSYPTKYWKDTNGEVFFRLAVSNGATGINNSIMTFPAGFRPGTGELFKGHVDNDNALGSGIFLITTGGLVQNIRTLASNSLIILNGSFKAIN